MFSEIKALKSRDFIEKNILLNSWISQPCEKWTKTLRCPGWAGGRGDVGEVGEGVASIEPISRLSRADPRPQILTLYCPLWPLGQRGGSRDLVAAAFPTDVYFSADGELVFIALTLIHLLISKVSLLAASFWKNITWWEQNVETF